MWGYIWVDFRIDAKHTLSMEAFPTSVKRRIARYLDAILYIAALLMISSLLELIRS